MSSPCSQALAITQSRFTVRIETSRTSAISCSGRPQKKRNSTMRLCRGSSWASLFNARSNASTSTTSDSPARVTRFVQRDFVPAAALGRLVTLGVIDQDLAHHMGGDSKEPRPGVAIGDGLVHEPHICFVYQSRRLKRVIEAFAAEITRGEPPQFAVHQGQQVIQRGLATAAPRQQQSSDASRVRLVRGIHGTDYMPLCGHIPKQIGHSWRHA